MSIIKLTINDTVNDYAIFSIRSNKANYYTIVFTAKQHVDTLNLIATLIANGINFIATFNKANWVIEFNCDNCRYEFDEYKIILKNIEIVEAAIAKQDATIDKLGNDVDFIETKINSLTCKDLTTQGIMQRAELLKEQASLSQVLRQLLVHRNEKLKLLAEYKQQLEQLKFNKSKAK